MDTNTTRGKAKMALAILGMALAVNSCSGIWDASIDPTWFDHSGELASVVIDAATERPADLHVG